MKSFAAPCSPPDREVCTIKIDDAYAYHPFWVFTLIDGVRDHVTYYHSTAAADYHHEVLVVPMTNQSGLEGRRMPTSASVRQRRRRER